MNILIVGCGKAGMILTRTLCQEEHNVTVMDIKPNLAENVLNNFDAQGITGNGLIIKDLQDAGVEEAHAVIAMTDSDETNILCCMMARKCGAKHAIARVRNPMFSQQLVFMRDELDISMMVNPEYQTANEIARMLRYPNAIHVESFANGRMELAEMRVTPGGIMDGLVLSALPSKMKLRLLVCAVMRDDQCFIPDGNFILRGNDRIYITAAHSELSKFYKQVGDVKNRIKSVMIVGGGKISYYLIRQLLELGMQVKIIEQDLKRCEQLSEWFPKADIICADGTDQDILLEEGIANVNACITLTGIDEENIILSLYAKKIGVNKIVTKINRTSLLPISDSVGLENIVSPKNTTAALILQYIRGKENSQGSNINTLYRLSEDKLEAIEFIVRGNADYIGVPLKKLKSGSGFLIAGIIRNNKRIIPTGDDCLKLNDSVIIVTTRQKVASLDAMFHAEEADRSS
ncbi:MAG: Trk system potassium transporter TrkA [Oscillospiraceae bacterium]|nr:Trk system potassium transporter TrkA [Oscillospiraceae bacterium]